MDPDKNAIISDRNSEALKVFSSERQLLHRIGKETPCTEKVGNCFGENILVSCREPFHCIKIF